MSINTLKKVIELVPDAVGHIKQAKVEKDFPTDCKDSVLASALEVEYLTKVAKEYVSDSVKNKVYKGVELYGLEEDLKRYSDTMTKSASRHPEEELSKEVQAAEMFFEGNVGGLSDLEKIASQAEDLYDSYAEYISSAAVKRYAGTESLSKEAAINALISRHRASGEKEFIKIAKVIRDTNLSTLDVDDNRTIARAVIELEKSANIYGRGFDFYREAFITKEASEDNLEVKLAGSNVTVGDIKNIGMSKIANYLGQDIAEGMGGEAASIKAVAESLPLDAQQMLARLAAG